MLDVDYPDDAESIGREETNFPAWVECRDQGSFAPYLVTPLARVREGLRLAQCTAEDRILDLGCGDGRFCAVSVVELGVAFAYGLDLDERAISRGLAVWGSQKYTRWSDRLKMEVKDFSDEAVLQDLLTKKFTVLVVVLTPDFERDHGWFLVEFARSQPNARILTVFFDLQSVDSLECINRSDKCFVYGLKDA